MKWFPILLLTLMFATPAFSQSETKVLIKGEYGLDTYQVFYVSGELKEEVTILNGKRHGEYKFYNQDGRLLIETDYRNGKEHGLRKVFNEQGALVAVIQYDQGLKGNITLPLVDLKEALAKKNE